MDTFLSYRREMLNDLLQITWKSYASSCKERGVFLTAGLLVVGIITIIIIIAHLWHSWDFQNYIRRLLLRRSALLSRPVNTKRKINLWMFLTGTFGAPRRGKLWLESASNMWLKYRLKRRRKLMKKRVLSDSSFSLLQNKPCQRWAQLEPPRNQVAWAKRWRFRALLLGIKRRRNQKESVAATADRWRCKSQSCVAVSGTSKKGWLVIKSSFSHPRILFLSFR